MKVKSESEVTQSCLTQRPHGLQPTRLLHPWDSPGKSTGVGCHCLLWVQGELGLKWRNREDIKNVYSSVHLGTWGIILALTRRNLWREEFVFSWLCFVLIHFSRVRLWAMPQTVACRAPLSVGFFRILQEYWTRLPFPSSGDLSDPRMEAASLSSPTLINIKLVKVSRSPDDWIWWYFETGALISLACDHSLVPNISSSS